MVTPLVSILVPCFNNERTLVASLESALAQTWPRCEVILVDDGSRDDSLALARSFEPRGVKVVAQANGGAGAARNAALNVARGDYIQYLDADDILSANKVEAQVRLLESLAACKVASCRWGRFEENPAAARWVPDETWRDLSAMEFLLLAAHANRMMPTAAWLVPRALAEVAGPWDLVPSPNDDGEYFCRVLLASDGIAFSPEGCSYYRSGQSGTLSSVKSERACRGILHSMELISGHFLAKEDSPRVRAALADHFQRIEHIAYARCTEVAEAAAARAREFGGSSLAPEMGKRTRWLARLIGWRAVWRLKALLQRSR